MGSNYSPFLKPFDQLTIEDLAALRTVHEGWYVEYKEAVPNPKSIAKSVSAFANTFGGFLFYGVREKSNDDNVADEFPGIVSSEIEAMRERIRQAIVAHAAPEPHFHIKVLSGPSETLKLSDDRGIICVHVPQSARAPHIHKSGVIYRRVADSSEPTPENDRHALDELFKRSDKLLETYRSWYEADPKFHYESEKSHPYLRLLVAFDPWRERSPWLPITTSEVCKLFNPEDKAATIPFDTVYPTREGFIARQTNGNGLDALTLTWALRRDLTSEILIPIPYMRADSEEGLQVDLSGYNQGTRFIQELQQRTYHSLRVLDLNQIFPILNGVFETLERLAIAADWKHGLSATFKVLNADRSCPFLDVEHVMDRYEKHGIPISLSFMSSLRENHHPNRFFEFTPRNEDGEELTPGIHAAILMVHLARSFGIPMWEDESDSNLDLLGELFNAGSRSMEAQRLRNRTR